MSEEHPDPQADGLERAAQLAMIAVTAAEGVVRVRASQTAARAAAVAASAPARRASPEPPRRRPGASAAASRDSPTAEATVRAGRRATPTSSATPERGARYHAAPGRSPSRDAPSISRQDLRAVHQQAADFFRDRFERSWAPSYLQQRGLAVAATDAWGAGYAPASWTALTDHLRGAGWDDAILEASGLSRRARTGNLIDHFRDRLVLPIRDGGQLGGGGVVAFIGRAAPGAPDGAPKYLNSPRTALYDKRAVLFGLDEGLTHLQNGGTPVLVEGPLDAIAVTTATRGRYVGLAPCGTSLTDAHVSRLVATVDVASRGVVVATDGDAAGVSAAIRAYDQLSPLTHRLLRADLPEGTDPADLLLRSGVEVLSAAVNEGARPLLDAVLDERLHAWTPQLQWVEGRVSAARDVAGLLATLPPRLRERYAARLADRLDLAPTTVTHIVSSTSATRSATAAPNGPAAGSPHTGATPSSTPPTPDPAVHSRRRR